MRKERKGVPPASSPAALKRMQSARPRDTAAELRLRRLLHARGLRYRVDQKPLPELRRKADVVFRRVRVAVYVDGCFWHGCPEHGTWPRENAEFWRNKIAENQKRDADTDERLRAAGWAVVRVWEHEDPEVAVSKIVALLETRREEGVR